MNNRRRICLLLCLTVLLLVSSVQSASAWDLLKWHWMSSRVPFYYANIIEQDWRTTIADSRDAWNSIGGSSGVSTGLYITYGSNVNSDSRFFKSYYPTDYWVGHCDADLPSNHNPLNFGWVVKAPIKINLSAPASDWKYYDTVPRVDANDPVMKWDGQGILTHELGHLVGIAHSDDMNATMWKTPNPNALGHYNWEYLSADDTTAAHSLYPGFYRLYKYPYHMYTRNLDERNNLISAGWNPEPNQGWLWGFSFKGTTSPIYRLNYGGDHVFTTNLTEAINLINAGWRDEGITGYCLLNQQTSDMVPLYRLYGGGYGHLYTVSLSEKNSLQNAGWSYEGIIGYVRYWALPCPPQ